MKIAFAFSALVALASGDDSVPTTRAPITAAPLTAAPAGVTTAAPVADALIVSVAPATATPIGSRAPVTSAPDPTNPGGGSGGGGGPGPPKEGNFPSCNVCGDELRITNPEAIVTIPNVGDRTCAEFQGEGDKGIIPSRDCKETPFIAIDCGCSKDPSYMLDGGSEPIDSTASPTAAPTSNGLTIHYGVYFATILAISSTSIFV